MSAAPAPITAAVDPWEQYERTLTDAFKQRKPPDYVVEKAIRAPTLMMVYGAPGDLKTTLELDRHIAIAAGQVWLPPLKGGPGGFKTVQSPTIWLDYDMGEEDLSERIEALARARGLNMANIPFRYYSLPQPAFDAGNIKHVWELIYRIKAFGARAVGMDNLGIIKGKADENSGEMIPVMNGLRLITEQTKAAVSVIHHQRKSNGVGGRDGDKIRGHSSIEASLNLALYVTRTDDDITVKATKHRNADFQTFSAKWTYTHKLDVNYCDTNELETAKFFGMPDPIWGMIDGAVTDALAGKIFTLNKTKLVDAIRTKLPNTGVNKIRDRIDELVNFGILKTQSGKKTECFYSL